LRKLWRTIIKSFINGFLIKRKEENVLVIDKRNSGEAVRIARAVRGWTQRELGVASGLPMWMIWQVENDVREVKAEEWAKIWGALATE
jgi:hypothetical protein